MNNLRRRAMVAGTVAPTLEISPQSLSFPYDGGSAQIVTVTSNTTWDVGV